jgi:hypothetical protein
MITGGSIVGQYAFLILTGCSKTEQRCVLKSTCYLAVTISRIAPKMDKNIIP